MKIPVTPSEIETAFFRLVLQCLDQLRQRVPQHLTGKGRDILYLREGYWPCAEIRVRGKISLFLFYTLPNAL
jgi:hypothetical protein